jgi:hypothetical protein
MQKRANISTSFTISSVISDGIFGEPIAVPLLEATPRDGCVVVTELVA